MTSTIEHMASLADRARAGDTRARDEIVQRMWKRIAGMAKHIACRHAVHVEPEELLNIGAAAILNALRTFDPSIGVRFTTHYLNTARGRMLDHLREEDPVPRLTRTRLKRLDRHRDTFIVEHGRNPSDEELRAATGMDDRDWKFHRRTKHHRTVSLYDPTGPDTGDDGPPRLIDEIAAPQDVTVAHNDVKDIIRFTLGRYGLRAGLMLKLAFVEGWTHRRISQVLIPRRPGAGQPIRTEPGVTESAICTQMKELIAKLREDLGEAA